MSHPVEWSDSEWEDFHLYSAWRQAWRAAQSELLNHGWEGDWRQGRLVMIGACLSIRFLRVSSYSIFSTVDSTCNPLGNLNSGRRPWAKLIRSASLQRVFDAAIAKLLCHLVSRCFNKSICVCFYDSVKLSRMRYNSTKRLSTVARWRHGKVHRYVRCACIKCRVRR